MLAVSRQLSALSFLSVDSFFFRRAKSDERRANHCFFSSPLSGLRTTDSGLKRMCPLFELFVAKKRLWLYHLIMISEGDLVFLYHDEKRNFLTRAAKNTLHTDKGYFKVQDIIGREFGETIKTNLNYSFYILRPYLYEMIMKVNRQTQILYPKDVGMILMKACIFPGAKVIECGIGSGGLTTALANFVRPDGKVYSYERNEDFLKNAQKNLKKNGLDKWVEFNHAEIADEFPEKDADFIMIDIGSQWELIEAAYKSLKGGCRLATICPTFEQLTKTVFSLQEKGFINIETEEILVRRILVRRGKTRPEQRMPSHTGWLVFATKITN